MRFSFRSAASAFTCLVIFFCGMGARPASAQLPLRGLPPILLHTDVQSNGDRISSGLVCEEFKVHLSNNGAQLVHPSVAGVWQRQHEQSYDEVFLAKSYDLRRTRRQGSHSWSSGYGSSTETDEYTGVLILTAQYVRGGVVQFIATSGPVTMTATDARRSWSSSYHSRSRHGYGSGSSSSSAASYGAEDSLERQIVHEAAYRLTVNLIEFTKDRLPPVASTGTLPTSSIEATSTQNVGGLVWSELMELSPENVRLIEQGVTFYRNPRDRSFSPEPLVARIQRCADGSVGVRFGSQPGHPPFRPDKDDLCRPKRR